MRLIGKVTTIIACLLITFGVSGQSIVSAGSSEEYVVKVGEQYYSYNAEDLQESFLDYTYGGGSSSLYLDFKSKRVSGDFHAIMNVSGKYISYKAIENAFLNDQDNFSLTNYMNSEKAQKATMPSRITSVYADNSGAVQTTTIQIDNGIVPEVINIY
ncbi:hypothetical protein [Aquibacillus salsiterrae]|uniref:Uncharacterized protein n=1 Tax=Aquibacillus salsiterrae TaxID=2950439 RepID=A0A9X4AE57_9BACI|nr:hypothetical protein [Aquibacillus salsiterrae]MDC3416109.1 hypothetical protein [Aquibacillus salsiterrae]